MDLRLKNIVTGLANRTFAPKEVGRKRADPEMILENVLFVLWSGCPWRALQGKNSVSYQTVHRHFLSWARNDLFRKAYEIAFRLQQRPVRNKVRFQCIDSTFVKNIYGRDCIGRNPTDRGRQATKLSAVVNQDGLPLSLVFFPANVSDFRTVQVTLSKSIKHKKVNRPQALYADKGFDSQKVRNTIRQFGFVDRVAKRGELPQPKLHRHRNVIERFFAWLDKSRRLLVRFDVYIAAYEAWTWLASLRLIRIP